MAKSKKVSTSSILRTETPVYHYYLPNDFLSINSDVKYKIGLYVDGVYQSHTQKEYNLNPASLVEVRIEDV